MKNLPESFNIFDAKLLDMDMCTICKAKLRMVYCKNCDIFIALANSRKLVKLYSGDTMKIIKSVPIK